MRTSPQLFERIASGRSPELPHRVWRDRITRLRDLLEKNSIDAILVYSGGMELSGHEWARYIANFEHPLWNSEVFILIPREGDCTLFLNSEFNAELAREMSPIKDVRSFRYFGQPLNKVEKYEGFVSLLKKALVEKRLTGKRLGLCREGMQGDLFPSLLDQAIIRAPLGITIINASDLLFKLIRTKTGYDIKMIRNTCELSSKAFKATIESAEPGVTEADLFATFVSMAARYGCEFTFSPTDWHFQIKGAIGSEYPNVPFRTTGRKLKRGDMLVIDIGIMYQGYRSDVARTVAVGKLSGRQKKIFETNLQAISAMEEILKPGVTSAEICRINHDVVKKAGIERVHMIQGHGIGILENEPPILVPTDQTRIDKGATVNLECWLGRPHIGQSAIEDTYLVTDRKPVRLTRLEREF